LPAAVRPDAVPRYPDRRPSPGDRHQYPRQDARAPGDALCLRADCAALSRKDRIGHNPPSSSWAVDLAALIAERGADSPLIPMPPVPCPGAAAATSISASPVLGRTAALSPMPVDLDDEERQALINLLTSRSSRAAYPLSPRTQQLKAIREKLQPALRPPERGPLSGSSPSRSHRRPK
jgi:hypothetical protein